MNYYQVEKSQKKKLTAGQSREILTKISLFGSFLDVRKGNFIVVTERFEVVLKT